MDSESEVRLFVERGPSGRPVYEKVPAHQVGPFWHLDASPGLAMGTAADDRLVVRDDSTFEVVERGGNIAVHVSCPSSAAQTVKDLDAGVSQLGGRCDGRSWTNDGRNLFFVSTIPSDAGFLPLEDVLNTFRSQVPDSEWYYVNVYDPADDATPLNWWLDK